MAKIPLFLVKILCLTMAQALSWSVSVDPQQGEEEGQHSLDLGSAGSKHARLLWAWMQQAPGRIGFWSAAESCFNPLARCTEDRHCRLLPSAARVGWGPSWGPVTSWV